VASWLDVWKGSFNVSLLRYIDKYMSKYVSTYKATDWYPAKTLTCPVLGRSLSIECFGNDRNCYKFSEYSALCSTISVYLNLQYHHAFIIYREGRGVTSNQTKPNIIALIYFERHLQKTSCKISFVDDERKKCELHPVFHRINFCFFFFFYFQRGGADSATGRQRPAL